MTNVTASPATNDVCVGAPATGAELTVFDVMAALVAAVEAVLELGELDEAPAGSGALLPAWPLSANAPTVTVIPEMDRILANRRFMRSTLKMPISLRARVDQGEIQYWSKALAAGSRRLFRFVSR
jgi:hypothetical protein